MKPTLTAALLAGGKSKRMGREKGSLRVEWKGVSTFLWERQVAVLRSVEPDELIISGSRKEGYPESVSVVPDRWPDMGPLGGIATCLERLRTDLLLVLAVDLACIQPEFPRKLLGRTRAGCGVVPVHHNRFEPLVAIYPAAAAGIAIAQLEKGELANQRFVERLMKEGKITGYNVDPAEEIQLTNWNRPDDIVRVSHGAVRNAD
ncbi:MAG TPA: NTP transferase domain-containing protein [Chthoniobacterales bacterium]|nr:NTP transferase domain-containing protein [Chthoniobacterales bacterium]